MGHKNVTLFWTITPMFLGGFLHFLYQWTDEWKLGKATWAEMVLSRASRTSLPSPEWRSVYVRRSAWTARKSLANTSWTARRISARQSTIAPVTESAVTDGCVKYTQKVGMSLHSSSLQHNAVKCLLNDLCKSLCASKWWCNDKNRTNDNSMIYKYYNLSKQEITKSEWATT